MIVCQLRAKACWRVAEYELMPIMDRFSRAVHLLQIHKIDSNHLKAKYLNAGRIDTPLLPLRAREYVDMIIEYVSGFSKTHYQ